MLSLFFSLILGQYSYEFFVREPVKLLREYPYAEQLLGKPIIAKNIKFDHDNVQVTQIRAKVSMNFLWQFEIAEGLEDWITACLKFFSPTCITMLQWRT